MHRLVGQVAIGGAVDRDAGCKAAADDTQHIQTGLQGNMLHIERRLWSTCEAGIFALQMELACRGYMDEPEDGPVEGAWPPPYDPVRAAPMRVALRDVLLACLAFASSTSETRP